MPLILTGGTGFLGHHLSDRIHAPHDNQIVRLVRNPSHAHFNEQTDVVGNLNNSSDVNYFVERGSVLVHLACTTRPRSSNQNIAADLEQNLLPTIRLFEAFARKQPGGHVVFASTGGDMYSFQPPHQLRHEALLPHPQSSYGIHKLAAEYYLGQFARTYGIAGTILRIGNAYGPIIGGRLNGLIEVALAAAKFDSKISLFDPMDSVRDYIGLDDLAEAFQACSDNPPSPGECVIFNVGTGRGHSIREILALIEQITRNKLRLCDEVPVGRRSSWNVLDISRIHAVTGWSPRTDVDVGIRRLWEEMCMQ